MVTKAKVLISEGTMDGGTIYRWSIGFSLGVPWCCKEDAVRDFRELATSLNLIEGKHWEFSA